MRSVWRLWLNPPWSSMKLGQNVLAEVTERRVPEIVGERQRFDEVLVQAERARDGPPDLAHLDRVRQPRAVVIALVIDEHLRLVFEAAKRARVDDPVAIPLIAASGSRDGLPGGGGRARERSFARTVRAHLRRAPSDGRIAMAGG